MAITVLEHDSREEWFERRSAISAFGTSELSALFDANPYHSNFAVMAARIHGLRSDGTDRMEWGLACEAGIGDKLCREYDLTVVSKPHSIVLNDDFPHLLDSPDFMVKTPDGEPANLQIKKVGRRAACDWDDGPPDYVRIQNQGEMAIQGVRLGFIGAEIAGDPPVLFHDEANERFQRAIRRVTDDFWAYVERGEFPEPTTLAVESTLRALKALHPDDNGEEVELPPEYDALWLTREEALKARKKAQAMIDFVDARFHAAIGDATFGHSPAGRWSLKTTQRSAYEVAETTYRTLRKVSR